MQPVLSSAQMREVDRLSTERFGIRSLDLMENAAAATARAIGDSLSGDVVAKRILVLCGSGNNGGDGAAVARLLALAGAEVDVVLLARVKATRGDARTNFDKARSIGRFYECDSPEEWSQLMPKLAVSYDIYLDALLGTGLTRPVQGVQREAAQYLRAVREMSADRNFASPLIVSIDIPSGLNADSSEIVGEVVQADITVTMTAPKPANILPPAASQNGRLIVAEIGSPRELIEAAGSKLFLAEESDARRWLTRTRYALDSYKNTHGHALVIAGCRGLTGAAVLCGNAAMQAGAGLVTVATPASSQSLVTARVMSEVMTAALAETDRGAVSDQAIDHAMKLAERANVVAVGPGLSSEDDRTRTFVRAVVERRRTPIVIDADGLNCLSPWPEALRGSDSSPIVLTPHAGEMLRLMGKGDKGALGDRVAVAREFATTYHLVLVLKGTRPLIATPDGRVIVNPTGNAGLGTAGAGDTLTGIIAGFLAQEYGTLGEQAHAVDAVVAALYIGGLAGDLAAREIGMRTMVASDIRRHLSAAICALDPAGERPPFRS